MTAPRGKITSYPREHRDGKVDDIDAVDHTGAVEDTGAANSTNSADSRPRERRGLGRSDLETSTNCAGDRLRRNRRTGRNGPAGPPSLRFHHAKFPALSP